MGSMRRQSPTVYDLSRKVPVQVVAVALVDLLSRRLFIKIATSSVAILISRPYKPISTTLSTQAMKLEWLRCRLHKVPTAGVRSSRSGGTLSSSRVEWAPRAVAPLRPPASTRKGFPRRKQGKTTVDFNTPGQTIIIILVNDLLLLIGVVTLSLK